MDDVIWCITDKDVKGMSENDVYFLCSALMDILQEYQEQVE